MQKSDVDFFYHVEWIYLVDSLVSYLKRENVRACQLLQNFFFKFIIVFI